MSNQVYSNETQIIDALRPRFYDNDNLLTTASAVAVPLVTLSLKLNPSTDYVASVNQFVRLTGALGQAGFGVQLQIDGGGYNYVAGGFILRDVALLETLVNSLNFGINIPDGSAGQIDIRIMGSVGGGGTLNQDHLSVSLFPSAIVIP